MANEAKQFTINGVTHDVMDVGARQLIADLQTAIDAITSGDTTTAIKTFQEVVDFLDGVTDDTTLIGKLNELRALINAKVDKVTGKGLSTNDYTTAEKQKLAGLSNYDDTALQTAVGNLQTDIANVYTKSQTYSKTEVDGMVANAGKVKSVSVNGGTGQQPDQNGNVNLQGVATEDYVDDAIDEAINDVVVGTVEGAVIDNLLSDSPTDSLSARMGKQLAQDVDDIPNIAISVVGNKIVINTNAALAPRIVISELSKSSMSARPGSTDTATFKVSGRRLTAAITAALSDSTHFSISPASISPSSGVVEETTLTVTYNPGSGATAGTSHSLTITIASGGVTYGTLQLTGTVAAAPSITLSPASLTISAESGQSGTSTINVKGTALDGDISLAISGSGFSLSDNLVSKADAESAGGKNITVTFDGSADGAPGTITASSAGATSVTASVSGSIIQRKAEGETIVNGGLTYTVLADTTKVSVKATSASLSGDIVIPSSVEDSGVNYEVASIPTQGFHGAQITSIVLPDTLKDIGGSAFFGCSALASIDFGNGLESISGGTAFFGTKLVNVVLPDSLKTCGNAPFQSISTLKSIQLGKTTDFSPTGIGNILTWAGSSTDDANDNSLDLVICYATTPPTLSNYPRGIAGAVLKVPSDSVSAYQAANNWDKFGTIEAI